MDKIYKVSCEYYIKAKDLDQVKEYVTEEIADGFEFYERHLLIDESNQIRNDIDVDLTK